MKSNNSNTALGCISIARLTNQSAGNVSIRGRLERWEGVKGARWAVPAEVVAARFDIPLAEVKAHAKAEAAVKAKNHALKLARIASKSKGGSK